MSVETYLVAGIASLATAVVTLWISNNKLHKKYADQSKEYLLANAKASEHLANSLDELPEKIVEKIIVNGLKIKK